MKRLTKRHLRLRSRQSGQGMVEYAVLLGLLALAIIGAVTLATQSVQTATSKTTGDIGGPGSDFTPGVAPSLGVGAPQPTVANKPPTSTPAPPTATPTNTAIPAPTNTLPPTNTPKPTNTPVPTATPNATQTAAAFATIAAQASGSAIRYRVDPNGWNNGSDGFCGTGDASQSGNQGLNVVNLYGDGGQTVCVRIDTFIGSMSTNTETHDFDLTNMQGNGSPTNAQMTLTKQAKYTTNITVVTNVLFTKQSGTTYSNVVPFYIMIKLPTDICTNNNTQTLQFKARDDSNAHGVKINTVCKPLPTATPTNTPRPPTATPTLGPTSTPAPTPTQVDSGT